MNLRPKILELETTHVFRISRSATARYRNVIAEVEHDGVIGIGEAAPSGFYGENAETVSSALDQFAPLLGEDPFALEIVEERLDRCLPGNYAAKAAVDMALHDLIGKLSGQPLYNDPFVGVRTEGGRTMLPDRPGLGVTKREGGE